MVGGIIFLLRCDFDPLELPFKLSNNHKQVLLYWKMLYKHDFSPHTEKLQSGKTDVFYKEENIIHTQMQVL